MNRYFRIAMNCLAVLCILWLPTGAGADYKGRFKGIFHGNVTVVPLTFPLFQVTTAGTGRGTRLGNFTLHETFTFNAITEEFSGDSTFTAANGDTLLGTTTGVFHNSFAATTVFTGGTGRFVGANGVVHVAGTPSQDGSLTTHITGTLFLHGQHGGQWGR